MNELLTLDDLANTMRLFREKHGKPMKAIKVSEETLHEIERMIPLMRPSQGRPNMLYSVPVQIDNDLALFECEPVYA